MDHSPFFLLHVEAFYPYENMLAEFKKATLPADFSHEKLKIALPYHYLLQAHTDLSTGGFILGANDMLDTSPESFTKSVAAPALQTASAAFVLLHKKTERQALHESPGTINNKLKTALQNQIPIYFCFGETAEEAEAGRSGEAIHEQIKTAFEDIATEQLAQVHFVYDVPLDHIDSPEKQTELRDAAYKLCVDQYASLWGEDIAHSIKTLCAVSPYLPIPKAYIEDSPFAGFYFRMVSADIEWLFEQAV